MCDNLHEIFVRDAHIEALKTENAELKATLKYRADRVEKLKAQLADICEAHEMVMSERCPTDEAHCTCVPVLRAELAKLREALPDDYNKSKDWKHGNLVGRIEWLKAMYNSANEYGSAMEDNCLYAAEELAELREASKWYFNVLHNPGFASDHEYNMRKTEAERALRALLHDKRG